MPEHISQWNILERKIFSMTIRRIGTILESLWYITDYRSLAEYEARDETRFLTFVNMVLNDAMYLLDCVVEDLE